MTAIQDIFAANVRRLRKEAHLSQEKLAELAGLHRTYIGGIEQKRVNVSLKNVEKIANALAVDPVALFLRTADINPDGCASNQACNFQISPDNPSYAIITMQDSRIVIQPICNHVQ